MAPLPLMLVNESKISDLIPHGRRKSRWEASGVLAKEGELFVVFDDRTEIARICDDFEPNSTNGLCGPSRRKLGYEGIAYNCAKQRFYLLVESLEHADGRHRALVVEYDDEFNHLKARPLDFIFGSSNKGFEAVAHVQRNGNDYLLALCEGNYCKCGEKGRTPGGGRIQMFEKAKKRWRHWRTIALPPSLPFVDYSGMSLRDGCVAIVSQVGSMLWVGQFEESDWSWCDAGKLYEFPRFDDGSIQYGNIEGVGWITSTRVVTVSDRRKKSKQPDPRLAEADQSVHIFDIPT